MNPEGPQLRDIHLPPDPSWWPPAPGWWVLALIGIVLLSWLARRMWRRWHQQRWRRRVLAEFDSAVAQHASAANHVALTAAISSLLRRTSRMLDVSGVALQGDAWLQFLDARMRGTEFTSGVGRVLLDAPFRPHAEVDAAALIALSRRWLQHVLAEVKAHA